MKKRQIAHIVAITLTLAVLMVFIYTLINFKILRNDISQAVQSGGILIMTVFYFLLEGIPNFVGLEPVMISAILLKINFWTIFFWICVAVILANSFSYYFGYVASGYVKGFVDKEKLENYEDLWHKHGKKAMVITAITPIPYIPALAGVFKMKASYFYTWVLFSRLARHFGVLLFLFVLFG